MPIKDLRAATAAKPKNSTAGRRVVSYVDAKGRSRNATVLGIGTSSGLKLQLIETGVIKDNVAAAASMGSVNCYRAR